MHCIALYQTVVTITLLGVRLTCITSFYLCRSYIFLQVPDSEQSQSFTITEDNRHTGMITLLQPVDHEAGSSVNLTVRAEDNATGANGDVAVLR